MKINPCFVEYAQKLCALHAADAEGDEAAADQIRDSMDRPGMELSGPEVQAAKALSARMEEIFRSLPRDH